MKRTTVVLEDDIDGTAIPDADAAPPTMLALNDRAVLLDLTAERRTELAAVLEPFLAAGRRVSLPRVKSLVELPPKHRRHKK